MKKKKIDPDIPFGKLTRVDDFLPPPEKLAMAQKNVKITISLSKESIDFFKEQAKLYHIKYQKMIRQILNRYVSRYS